MKLFTVGPVEMHEESLRIGGEQMPYFRTKEFSEKMLHMEEQYLELLGAKEGTRLVVLTASGTGAMEAAVMNTLSQQDKVLIIVGGGFGERFAQLCEVHHIPYEGLNLGVAEQLTAQMMEQYKGKGFTALLVNMHETSTGQLYDVKMLGDFCKEQKMLYVMDAISAFLVDPLNMAQTGADVVITASQKALSLAPGLSFVALSSKAQSRLHEKRVQSMYFDFSIYLEDMKRGQTPFTPAVGIIMQLEERLTCLCEQGIRAINEQHKSQAEFFRGLCKKNNLKILDVPLSSGLTPLWFEGNAQEVFHKMKKEKQFMLTPNGGALAGHILRVGHMGNLKNEDYCEVIQALMEVI